MTDTAPDTGTEAGTTDTTTPDTGTDATDWQAEAEKFKALARKHEERAKASATAQKELDALKARHMTETEKAIEAAKAEGRAEALNEAGAKIARAEFKAATADRMDDDGLEALLEGLDLKAFLDSNGDVDAAKIAAFADRIAPKQDAASFHAADIGQGSHGKPLLSSTDPLLRDVTRLLG